MYAGVPSVKTKAPCTKYPQTYLPTPSPEMDDPVTLMTTVTPVATASRIIEQNHLTAISATFMELQSSDSEPSDSINSAQRNCLSPADNYDNYSVITTVEETIPMAISKTKLKYDN